MLCMFDGLNSLIPEITITPYPEYNNMCAFIMYFSICNDLQAYKYWYISQPHTNINTWTPTHAHTHLHRDTHTHTDRAIIYVPHL